MLRAGLQPVEWQDPVIDEPKLRAARSGRLGFTFVVIAMRCWQAACQMFLPNRTTQRELDIQKRRDPAAEKEDIWNPCLLYTSPSPRDKRQTRMPSSA